MMPQDVAIWERFIDQNVNFFDSVDYDVTVGSTPQFDTIVNPATGGDAARLYQRKIDVVGYKDNDVYIIEVKPNAGASALGQIQSYATLYKYFRDLNIKTIPTILTDRMTTDMALLSHEFKIKILIA